MGTKSAPFPTKSLRKAEGLGSICLWYIQMDIISISQKQGHR